MILVNIKNFVYIMDIAYLVEVWRMMAVPLYDRLLIVSLFAVH